MTQQPDSPTSQFTAVRWTFYRRIGLLLRTRLQDDGTTYSLHDVADRTGGRVSATELMELLARGAHARPDVITCILLAHAFDVDPDYFVSDGAVEAYLREHHQSQMSFGAAMSQQSHVESALVGAGKATVSTH